MSTKNVSFKIRLLPGKRGSLATPDGRLDASNAEYLATKVANTCVLNFNDVLQPATEPSVRFHLDQQYLYVDLICTHAPDGMVALVWRNTVMTAPGQFIQNIISTTTAMLQAWVAGDFGKVMIADYTPQGALIRV